MIGQECIDELADYAGFKDKVAAITERAMQGELDFAARAARAGRLARRASTRRCSTDACRGADPAQSRRGDPGRERCKREGALTVLVSGGFTAFVEPVAEQLGFDRFEANRLAVEDGKLTGRTVGEIVDAAAKRRVAEQIRARSEARAGIAGGDRRRRQ